MDIEEIKRETMKQLGLDSTEELEYITEEFLADIESGESEDPDNDLSDAEGIATSSYAVYGNSLVFLSGKVKYRRNDKGTPNYGCGSNKWTWTARRGDSFTPRRKKCPNGKKEYLLKRA